MKQWEYAEQDAVGLAALISGGQVSTEEVAQAARHAAARLNPEINAFVEIWDDDSVGTTGPFAGVPFAVKDIGLTVAGRKIEFGSRLAEGLRMEQDSDLMTRFRSAGFTAIGRTAIPEFAMSTTTEPVFGGPTRNPWDLARSAGGSSGGAAAAVAAGIVPIAHATDAGGSIRVPAASTGLVGLKPSRGRVSFGPGLDEIWGGLATQFVLTKTVRDSAAILDVLHGPNVGEPFEISGPSQPYAELLERPGGPLRIGYMAHPLNGRRSAARIVAALDATLRTLEGMGHHVEEAVFDVGASWDAYAAATGTFWVAHNAAFMEWLSSTLDRPIDLGTVEPTTLAVYRQGAGTSAIQLIDAGGIRNAITRAVGRLFSRYDVLVTPSLPDLPIPLGRLHADVDDLDGSGWVARVLDHAAFSGIFNMSGTPAISLPLAHDEASGLPIGMQFAARFGAEDVLLQLAAQLEIAAPWASRKPAVWAGL